MAISSHKNLIWLHLKKSKLRLVDPLRKADGLLLWAESHDIKIRHIYR